MKDILVIGGPRTLQGVEQIDDDLVSILSASNLYDRKWVVLWPTPQFLAIPDNPDALKKYTNLNDVVGAVADKKGLIPTSPAALLPLEHITNLASTDENAIDTECTRQALAEAVNRLAKLQVAVAGGLNLAVVIEDDPPHALCWTSLITDVKASSNSFVADYNAATPLYGILNSVDKWGIEFEKASPLPTTLNQLLPLGNLDVLKHTLPFDRDWYSDTTNFENEAVQITFPVISRMGAAKCIAASIRNGRMIFMSAPAKPKNFIISMKTGKSPSNAGKGSTPRPATKSSVSYLTRQEAADMLKITTKTIDRRLAAGDLTSKKSGSRVLISLASIEASLQGKAS